MERYPKATLQDIYKGCFQDFFGPAHALSNREGVKRYILSEMEEVSSESEPYIEPCGWREDYYRFDLSLVKSGVVELESYVDAFIGSATAVDTQRIDAWKREWIVIQQVVRAARPHLEGFERDSAMIADLLNYGQYVVHHSDSFNEAYHPHYRIIQKNNVNQILSQSQFYEYLVR